MAAYSDLKNGKSYIGSVGVKVAVPDFVFKNREKLREFRRHMRVAHEKGINDGVEILQRVLQDKNIRDTGALIDSVTRKLFVRTTDIFSGVVYFKKPGSDYAYFVEHGRQPGTPPPMAAIIDWAKRHGMSYRQAMFVRWKIGEDGVDPRPFFEEAAEKIHKNYKEVIDDAIDKYRRNIK